VSQVAEPSAVAPDPESNVSDKCAPKNSLQHPATTLGSVNVSATLKLTHQSDIPKLELETQPEAYLTPSRFLLSRISGDCAVLSVIVKRPAFG
jgi:hypothetical protein